VSITIHFCLKLTNVTDDKNDFKTHNKTMSKDELTENELVNLSDPRGRE